MTTLLKKTIFSAAVTLLVASCANPVSPGGVTQAVGDAAVDSVTQNSSILTKTAVRNATGFGTDPVQAKATGLLNSIGL